MPNRAKSCFKPFETTVGSTPLATLTKPRLPATTWNEFLSSWFVVTNPVKKTPFMIPATVTCRETAVPFGSSPMICRVSPGSGVASVVGGPRTFTNPKDHTTFVEPGSVTAFQTSAVVL